MTAVFFYFIRQLFVVCIPYDRLHADIKALKKLASRA